MRWHKQVAVTAALGALFACTKSGPHATSPEAALENYVKIAFSAKTVEDGKNLLKLSTGEALEWLSSMPEEAFKKQFVDNHMVLQSFSTKDLRQEKDGDVSLVYEIAFKDGAENGDPTHQAVYTNKKIAYLSKDKDSGEWKIRATKNMKTFIERKDALEIPPNPPGWKDPDEKPAK